MKDVSRAAQARAAYLEAEGSDESAYQGETLLLDLMTLLVMTKGAQCTPDDIKQAWLVAGLRWGPNHPVVFDMLDDSADESISNDIAYDDWVTVLNAAAELARRDDDRPGGAA